MLKVDTVQCDMRKAYCKIVHKGCYDLGPIALNEMFELYVPNRELRSSDGLLVQTPQTRTQFGWKNIRNRGGIYWNMLPLELKGATTIEMLKNQLKKYSGFDMG